MADPVNFVVKKLPFDFVVKKLPFDLSSNDCLTLVGRINLPQMIVSQSPVRAGMDNSDSFSCYLGPHTLRKNDFESVESFRRRCLVHQALGLRPMPSSAKPRQRFDAMVRSVQLD